MTTMLFCCETDCLKPALGAVRLDDIAGSIEYPGQCREHLLAARADLEYNHRSSRVTIAWQGCSHCGGEGTESEGQPCPDCGDLTEQGGPLRFGDSMHNGDNFGMYVGPADRADLFTIALPQPTPPGWSMTAYHAMWDRCGTTPCNHPTTEEIAP